MTPEERGMLDEAVRRVEGEDNTGIGLTPEEREAYLVKAVERAQLAIQRKDQEYWVLRDELNEAHELNRLLMKRILTVSEEGL